MLGAVSQRDPVHRRSRLVVGTSAFTGKSYSWLTCSSMAMVSVLSLEGVDTNCRYSCDNVPICRLGGNKVENWWLVADGGSPSAGEDLQFVVICFTCNKI